ncbi:hypothetical protein [Streptomyces sp. NPDC054863]
MTDITEAMVTGITPRSGPGSRESLPFRRLLLAWAGVHAVLAAGCYAAGVPLFGIGPHVTPDVLNRCAVAVAVAPARHSVASARVPR